MNKLKNLLSVLTFALGIGSAFALTATNGKGDLVQNVKGKDSSCPTGQVDNTCSTSNNGQTCTFEILSVEYEAVPLGSQNCATASVMKFPI